MKRLCRGHSSRPQNFGAFGVFTRSLFDSFQSWKVHLPMSAPSTFHIGSLPSSVSFVSRVLHFCSHPHSNLDLLLARVLVLWKFHGNYHPDSCIQPHIRSHIMIPGYMRSLYLFVEWLLIHTQKRNPREWLSILNI